MSKYKPTGAHKQIAHSFFIDDGWEEGVSLEHCKAGLFLITYQIDSKDRVCSKEPRFNNCSRAGENYKRISNKHCNGSKIQAACLDAKRGYKT